MVDTAYFLAITLVFLRVTTFFIVLEVLFPTGTPKLLKGVLGLIVSYGVVSGIDYSNILEINNNFTLIMYMVNEIIVGAILGYISNLVFQMVIVAGSYMDMQVGFAMMTVMDPSSNANITMLGNLSKLMAMVMFFIVDGHHTLIRCLIKSFNVVKLGQGLIFTDTFQVILDAVVNFFLIGVKIAIPVVLIIIITDLCMGLVSRTVPQINVMILGMPIKIGVGLITFVVLIPVTVKILAYAFDLIPDFIDKILKTAQFAPLMLIFADDGDKTEEATPKKLEDAKKKGQIPRSKDVNLACTMLVCTMVVLLLSGFIVDNLKDTMIYFLNSDYIKQTTSLNVKANILQFMLKAAICILPFVVPIMIGGVVGSLIQSGFIMTTETLKPSLQKLNPLKGFKNMFSKKSLADLGKNLAVVILISYIGYSYVMDNYHDIMNVSNMYLPDIGIEIRSLVVGIFIKVTIVLIILAVVDYILQRRFFLKDMRMTKQEVKDEYKQMEGDPQIKGKIKQKQRALANQRMMSNVADATVVITNPTHYAVAIKYIDKEMPAPKVVAKGVDYLALKIKDLAKENKVPIMENKALARAIYDKIEVDQEISPEMYQAVAEILAMVFKMNLNKK